MMSFMQKNSIESHTLLLDMYDQASYEGHFFKLTTSTFDSSPTMTYDPTWVYFDMISHNS